MRSRQAYLLFLIWIAATCGGRPVRAETPDAFFDEQIAPLLGRRCLECHNETDRQGGLDLSHPDAARRGGEGGVAIRPGNLDDSFLWQRVSQDEMPPEDPLPPAEKELLGRWIAEGAKWGRGPIDLFRFTTDRRAGFDWWALQPLRKDLDVALAASLQAPSAAERAGNPIDVFVLAKLRLIGLRLSPPAERRTLIRRLSFDLLGLPPDAAAVEEFVSNPATDAYERLTDRLLASFHYGERWARHWLDVARFGESQGFERDKLRSNSWRYRDWVIAAFNEDMPYDRFVRWQLAGDVLKPEDPGAVIATGFLVAGPYDEVGHSQQSDAMKAVVRQDELEDIASAVGQTFLGLTINCARCHDHKFDPVRQSEYYQLTAALSGVWHGQREIPSAAAPRSSRHGTRGVETRLRSTEQQIAAIEGPVRKQFSTEEISAHLAPEKRGLHSQLRFELEQLKSQRTRYGETSVYAVAPQPPGVTHVLLRGNSAQIGDAVAAGGVAALVGVNADFGLSPDAPDALRRKSLARWITDRHNPLFARVIVNRLWHHHFGVGLVDTPNDFGFNGGRPTHPLLLDWLARELIRSDWSLKTIQRLIITSSVYRQSSQLNQAGLKIDAENRMLWRKTPQRLEAEAIRDAILIVSGELNPIVYGPGFHDFRTFTSNSQFYEMRDPVGPTFHRRSLYRTWARSGRNPFLDVFDCPDPSAKAPQRAVTITPLQALALQNDSFVLRMANRFAARVRREAGAKVAGQVVRAYQLAYGRQPEAEEVKITTPLVQHHDLAALARVLFNTNEFLYVD